MTWVGSGGGYRRKRDQDTLAKSSRLRTEALIGGPITSTTITLHGVLAGHSTARSMYLDITSIDGGFDTDIYRISYELEIDDVVVYTSPIFAYVTLDYIVQNFKDQNLHHADYNDIFKKRRLRVTITDGLYTYVSPWTTPFTYSPNIALTSVDVDIYYDYSDIVTTATEFAAVDSTGYTALRLTNFVQTGATEDSQSFALLVYSTTNDSQQSYDFGNYTTVGGLPPLTAQGAPGIAAGVDEGDMLTNMNVQLDPLNWPAGVAKTAATGYPAFWNLALPTQTLFTIDGFQVTILGDIETYNMEHTFSMSVWPVSGTNMTSVGFNIGIENTLRYYRNGRAVGTMAGPSSDGQVLMNPTVTPYAPTWMSGLARDGDLEGPMVLETEMVLDYRGHALHTKRSNPQAFPPRVNTITVEIQNQTATGYDIVLTAFDGFTNFQFDENDEYSFQIKFKPGTNELSYPGSTQTVTYNPATNTLPYTLYSPDKLGADSSWWPSTPEPHHLDVFVMYNLVDLLGGVSVNENFTVIFSKDEAITDAFSEVYEFSLATQVTLTDIQSFITFTDNSDQEVLTDIADQGQAMTTRYGNGTVNLDAQGYKLLMPSTSIGWGSSLFVVPSGSWTFVAVVQILNVEARFTYGITGNGFNIDPRPLENKLHFWPVQLNMFGGLLTDWPSARCSILYFSSNGSNNTFTRVIYSAKDESYNSSVVVNSGNTFTIGSPTQTSPGGAANLYASAFINGVHATDTVNSTMMNDIISYFDTKYNV